MTHVDPSPLTLAGAASDTAARPPRSRRLLGSGWLILPAVGLLLVFFVYPIGQIIWNTVSEPSLGLRHYTDLWNDHVSRTVLIRTFCTALAIAGIALVLAYPYAYAMTRVSPRVRALLTLAVMLPFWTSLMARNFAWYVLESQNGPIDKVTSALGLHGMVLLYTVPGVAVAMVQVMLPFMVLPLYSCMSGIDDRLVAVAGTLGAPRHRAFLRAYVPLSLPGVLSGFTLVFVLALGFYLTPLLLGSPQHALISQVIGSKVTAQLDFVGGGALGTVLLVITLVILYAVSRVARLSGGEGVKL